MTALHSKKYQDKLSRRWLDKMLTTVRDRPDAKEQRKILYVGRAQICNQARLLARQNHAKLTGWREAKRAERITVLRRLCLSQYILRTRDLASRDIPTDDWKREPDQPRQPGSDADIIAHANRVGAACATRDEDRIATAIDNLLLAAKHKLDVPKKATPITVKHKPDAPKKAKPIAAKRKPDAPKKGKPKLTPPAAKSAPVPRPRRTAAPRRRSDNTRRRPNPRPKL